MVKNLLFFDCLGVEPVFRKNKSSFAEICFFCVNLHWYIIVVIIIKILIINNLT